MQTTPNLGLKKPEGTDVVDIADLNGNMDTLDAEVFKKASASADGRMSKEDFAKLAGIAAGANNYVHPVGDGNQHIPATGTTNSGKVLTAGSTPGSASWQTPSATPLDGSIITSKLADQAVTTAKLADGATTNAKIANATIDAGTKLVDGSIITAKLADGAVSDRAIGQRTVNDSAGAKNPGTYTELLNSVAYMIRQSTGKATWLQTPRVNLENAVDRHGDTMTGPLVAPGVSLTEGSVTTTAQEFRFYGPTWAYPSSAAAMKTGGLVATDDYGEPNPPQGVLHGKYGLMWGGEFMARTRYNPTTRKPEYFETITNTWKELSGGVKPIGAGNNVKHQSYQSGLGQLLQMTNTNAMYLGIKFAPPGPGDFKLTFSHMTTQSMSDSTGTLGIAIAGPPDTINTNTGGSVYKNVDVPPVNWLTALGTQVPYSYQQGGLLGKGVNTVYTPQGAPQWRGYTIVIRVFSNAPVYLLLQPYYGGTVADINIYYDELGG